MTARIHRGFHRVGVVSILFAVLVAIVSDERRLALFPLALAALLYTTARAVGWVLAGFVGTDGTPSP